MTDLAQFQRIVGTEKILKFLQGVAQEAIEAQDWFKVRQLAELAAEISGHPISQLVGMEAASEEPEVPLTTLNISNRCLELLRKAAINTLADLQRYTLEGLLEINGIGEVAAQQIDNALQTQGIVLPSVELRSRWQEETPSFASNSFPESEPTAEPYPDESEQNINDEPSVL